MRTLRRASGKKEPKKERQKPINIIADNKNQTHNKSLVQPHVCRSVCRMCGLRMWFGMAKVYLEINFVFRVPTAEPKKVDLQTMVRIEIG